MRRLSHRDWPNVLATLHFSIAAPCRTAVRSSSHRPAARLVRSAPRRNLVTLAIETSCDDTCVAVLETRGPGSPAAKLHFNRKITSDCRAYQGVHPVVSVESHSTQLARLVREALQHLPAPTTTTASTSGPPVDLVAVTRGPGMLANLSTGLNTAKGLAVAWDVPLLGVHHMQAHALTPRLVSALSSSSPSSSSSGGPRPEFPFLTLLVSGGHTMLVLSRSLCAHPVLVPDGGPLPVGDLLDKCARAVLPPAELAAAPDTMYGALLERFAFPAGPLDYADYAAAEEGGDRLLDVDGTGALVLQPPLWESRAPVYNLTGLGSQVRRAVVRDPDMGVERRRALARAVQRLAFEHLASRVVRCLAGERVRTLVVSGGVAGNGFLRRVLRTALDARGFGEVEIEAPPKELCTDNAAMIGWAAAEMWEAGWRSELDILAIRKWTLDPEGEDGGILGVGGWRRRDGMDIDQS